MHNKKFFFIETGELQTSREKLISDAKKSQAEEEKRKREEPVAQTYNMGTQVQIDGCSICGKEVCEHLNSSVRIPVFHHG